MNKYTKTFAQAMQEVRETKDSNYKFDGKVVSISKANFNKVGKDYKNATPGQERMVILDPKTHGTISAPVKFTEDYEVSMAIGQLRTINEYATKLISILEAKGSDYNIEAWVQSKITTAEDYMNSVGHYMENNPEITNEAKEEPKETDIDKIKLAKEKDTDALEAQIVDLKGRLALVTQKLENEKNKVVKPEANPETGEVPLRTGLANAILDKKMNTKDLVKSKKKDEIKVGGKTKIEVNPDKDIGNFSGGMRTNAGNLH